MQGCATIPLRHNEKLVHVLNFIQHNITSMYIYDVSIYKVIWSMILTQWYSLPVQMYN